jgi:hypothetical protein
MDSQSQTASPLAELNICREFYRTTSFRLFGKLPAEYQPLQYDGVCRNTHA